MLAKREPHYRDSSLVWKLCETGVMEGHVSALTIANIVYILRPSLDPERLQFTIQVLRRIFTIDSLSAEDLSKAASLRCRDYEDSVQYITATMVREDAIITRNIKYYENRDIKAMTPKQVLGSLDSI